MYLLPVPQFLEYNRQEFVIRYDTKIIVHSNLGFQEIGYAQILQRQVKETLCFTLGIKKADLEEENAILFRIDALLKKEEYQIDIRNHGIHLIGGSSEALLYAVQTLRQIITQKGSILPGLKIADYPQIKQRGYYFDVTRGRIPTLQTLKELVDKLSYYKINQLQLYVEHSFFFEGFSEVWRDDTPLTAQEILELDRYCKSLNIELVPSIASFGHLHKLLSTKTYGELCELENSVQEVFSYTGRMEHHTIDVTNEKSFEVICTMLFEFMSLFSSNLFNICADETFDLGKGKSKQAAAEIGLDALYINFVNRLCRVVVEHGKRPMFWGDVVLQRPESIKELPDNVVCLNWDYGVNHSDENVKKLYELGVTQYVCPGVHGWRRLLNHYKHAYDNITRMCQYAHQYKAEGLLNTDWGDYGHINHPEFSTTGMIYGAAFSWNVNKLDFEEINRQISVVEYGNSSKIFVSIISDIGSREGFLWNHAIQLKEAMQKKQFENKLIELRKDLKPETCWKENEEIKKAESRLYSIMSHMEKKKRSVVKAYLIAAEGMQIFNLIGEVIVRQESQEADWKEIDAMELAARLEYWFMDYKTIWREQYKESELYRIMEVIVWYADFLRKI